MAILSLQEVRRLVAGLPISAWSGEVCRWHRIGRAFDSVRGSEIVSGRYHRARPQAPRGPTWRALYTSLDKGALLGEVIRYMGDDGPKSIKDRHISEIEAQLSRVLDVRDLAHLGVPPRALLRDRDWTIPHRPTLSQKLALAASELEIEGLLVPAASRIGSNLVVLYDNLLKTSVLRRTNSFKPNLYVPRP